MCRSSRVRPSWKERAEDLEEQSEGECGVSEWREKEARRRTGNAEGSLDESRVGGDGL